jgi:hypothetical protein
VLRTACTPIAIAVLFGQERASTAQAGLTARQQHDNDPFRTEDSAQRTRRSAVLTIVLNVTVITCLLPHECSTIGAARRPGSTQVCSKQQESPHRHGTHMLMAMHTPVTSARDSHPVPRTTDSSAFTEAWRKELVHVIESYACPCLHNLTAPNSLVPPHYAHPCCVFKIAASRLGDHSSPTLGSTVYPRVIVAPFSHGTVLATL